MASLTGTSIQSTYDSLLKISGNDALTSSLQRITDGLGNFSPLYLSTTAVEISSGLNVIGSITGSNLSGTNTGDETNSSIKSKLGAATSSNDGYLTSTDWSTFNAKGNGTVTSVSGTGTVSGLTLTGTVTSSGSLTLGGSLTLTSGQITTGLGYTPYNATNPNNYIALTALSASSPLSYNSSTGAFSIQQATALQNGFLSSTDWSTFNNKQNALGYTPVPNTRTLTINGTSYDLSADRSWTISSGLSGSGTTNYVAKFTGSTSLGNSLIFDNGTNVGIGTSSPNEKLSVIGAISANNGMIVQGYSAAASGLNCEMGVVSGYVQYNAYNRTTSAYGQFRLDGSSIALNAGSGGNVGIGTSSPNAYSGFVGLTLDSASNGGVLSIRKNGTTYLNIYSGTNLANIYTEGGSTALTFGTGGSERMRIDSGGYLQIAGTTTYNSSRVNIEAGTDLSGITTNVNSSDTRYHLYFRNTLATVGSISTNSYATSFNTSSDYRLKEDFKPFNGLSILNGIKVYDFKWKGVEQRNYGVVAHEVEEVLPYIVNGEKDGEMYQSVDYSKLVPVLIQAIQELTEKVNKLENGI